MIKEIFLIRATCYRVVINIDWQYKMQDIWSTTSDELLNEL